MQAIGRACSGPRHYDRPRFLAPDELRRRFEAQLRQERGAAWMQENAPYLGAQWQGMLDLGLV